MILNKITDCKFIIYSSIRLLFTFYYIIHIWRCHKSGKSGKTMKNDKNQEKLTGHIFLSREIWCKHALNIIRKLIITKHYILLLLFSKKLCFCDSYFIQCLFDMLNKLKSYMTSMYINKNFFLNYIVLSLLFCIFEFVLMKNFIYKNQSLFF